MQVIKIRLPYLQSIEKGAWDELPGEVYVRGFVKRYADFLGLDVVALNGAIFGGPISGGGGEPGFQYATLLRSQPLAVLWIGIIEFSSWFSSADSKGRTAPLKSSPPSVSSTATAAIMVSPTPASPATACGAAQACVGNFFTLSTVVARHPASDKTFEGFIPQAASWTWHGEGTFNVSFRAYQTGCVVV